MLIWLVMRGRSNRQRRRDADRAGDRASSTRKRSSAGARGPTTSERRFRQSSGLVRARAGGRAGTSSRCSSWRARGRSALLVAATGAGKTLAGFLPTICELAEEPGAKALHTLYVSPLKALAVDVQRNLIGPIEEMGLPIRVETRTGDTPSDRKARQRVKPPQMLLTTPELLSLLLSYPDAPQMFEGLRTIVVDELHGFAKEKRGDLLSLSMSRLQKLAPGLRRVGLSATISDPDAYRSWLAPDADMELVDLVIGDPGAEPDLSILIPENKIPWGGPFGPPRRRAR